MSRIEAFKVAPLAVVTPSWTPERKAHHQEAKSSLVGAEIVYTPGLRPMYKYADGRVCSHPDGAAHSCEYVAARNRLIPRAEQAANAECRRRASEIPPPNFDRIFMANMTSLWEGR